MELGCTKLASGKVQSSEAHTVAEVGQCRQKIILFGTQRGICGRSRRDHARHFPTHQFLGQSRIFHLLTDGHLESFANKFGDVAFGRVIGHTAHGHGHALFLVARGQCDLQFTRGHLCIVEEKFVEIAQTKEKQRAGMFLLDGGVLPHQRSGRLGHLLRVRARIITNRNIISVTQFIVDAAFVPVFSLAHGATQRSHHPLMGDHRRRSY